MPKTLTMGAVEMECRIRATRLATDAPESGSLALSGRKGRLSHAKPIIAIGTGTCERGKGSEVHAIGASRGSNPRKRRRTREGLAASNGCSS